MRNAVLLLVSTLFLLGCISTPQDSTQVVKALPQVQAFLNEHPNAEIKVVFQPKGSANVTDIRQKCGSHMQEQDYWFGSVKEGTVFIEVWLDGSSQKLLCAYKSPTTTPIPTPTTTQQTTVPSPTTVVSSPLPLQTVAQSILPFSVQTPQGWEKDESGTFGTLAVWFGPRENNFTVNINLIKEDVGALTLEQYDELSLKNAPNLLTDFELKSKDDKTADGIAAKSYTYSFRQGQNAFRVKNLFFIQEGKAYTFTLTTLASNFEKHAPVFDQLIASLRFETKSPLATTSETVTPAPTLSKPVGTPTRAEIPSPTIQPTATASPTPATTPSQPTPATIQQQAQTNCISLCKSEKQAARDLSKGPCLSNAIAPDWLCDVAHSPRQTVDDDSANQCPEFGKTANHFVEVDESCNVIAVV